MHLMDKRRSAAPIIAAVLLLLPVLYVESYFALVVPRGIDQPEPADPWAIPPEVHYRVGGTVSATIFAPLEAVDRRLRPDAWGPHWIDR